MSAATDIREYSIDANGDTMVFSPASTPAQTAPQHSTQEITDGYRVPFQPATSTEFPAGRLLETHREKDRWTKPTAIQIRSPFSNALLTGIPYQVGLFPVISPDGRQVLIRYIDDPKGMPEAWKRNPFEKLLADNGFIGTPLLALYDLRSKRTTVPLETPWTQNVPLWSPDSQSFVVNAVSAVGSRWEERDRQNQSSGEKHLFWVRLGTEEVDCIASHVANTSEQALAWDRNETLFVHTSANTIGRFVHKDNSWHQDESAVIPLPDLYRFAQMTTNGTYVAGEYQSAMVPPEIFLYPSDGKSVEVLQKLNPQFENLLLAPVEKIHWSTDTGYVVDGFLFIPPDYKSDERYPLVIQTKPDAGGFVCDSGVNHYPSFAPQPIADAGMMYLIRNYPESWNMTQEIEHYSKKYPHGVDEAAFETEVWDSAVRSLTAQGMIDPQRVGIIGFSRSGWYTEFALAFGKTRYAAATVTDNIQYSFSEYFLHHTRQIMQDANAIYGGPPSGETLHNWMNYSISFNMDKIHAPLLMEEMGHNAPMESGLSVPINLAAHYELFAGLNALGRPVELYYYPLEAHQPDAPRARLETLQRNLDWYRFWLQGYKRPSPEDTSQYVRWDHLKSLTSVENTP